MAGVPSIKLMQEIKIMEPLFGFSTLGLSHKGNVPRTRGIALWENLIIANCQDGRVIGINSENGEMSFQEDKRVEKNRVRSDGEISYRPLVADGKVLIQNGAGDGGTREVRLQP
jgi:alcohol dehydrogenase (cytochrome c)